MACCLTAPSHYLNQCWLIIKGVLWHYHYSIFTRSAQELNLLHVFRDYTLKIATKSPRGQWVEAAQDWPNHYSKHTHTQIQTHAKTHTQPGNVCVVLCAHNTYIQQIPHTLKMSFMSVYTKCNEIKFYSLWWVVKLKRRVHILVYFFLNGYSVNQKIFPDIKF